MGAELGPPGPGAQEVCAGWGGGDACISPGVRPGHHTALLIPVVLGNLLSPPFHRWENRGQEKCSGFPKVS